MTLSISIRAAQESDLAQIVELFNLYRCFYGKESELALAQDFIAQRLQNNDSRILVAATNQQQLVGFVQLYPIFSSISAQKAWLLNDLFIRAEFRQQGIAAKLISKSIKLGAESAAAWILLQTRHNNYTAQKLYEKLGFVRDTEYLTYSYNLGN